MRGDSLKSQSLQRRARRVIARLIIVPLALMALAGCGGESWQVRTYPATGRLTVNGQPAEGAVVTLHPLGDKIDQRGSNPWGIVQADGSFVLSTYETGDGAPQGEYGVAVKWPVDVADMSAAMIDRLGGAYANAERSGWKVAIEQRKNELAPIDIQGAKVKSQHDAKSHRRAPPMPGMQAK